MVYSRCGGWPRALHPIARAAASKGQIRQREENTVRPHILSLLFAAAVTLAQAETAPATADSGDRIVGGGSIRQTKSVGGDLVGIAGEFELAAPVEGKALLAGGNVRVTSRVDRDLFAAAGNVTIAAAVGGHARVAGGNVELTAAGSVERDFSVAGGDVDIRGPVGGNVHLGAGNVLIDSAIGGDVRVASGDLKLGPNARIAGRLIHHGVNVTRDPAAVVEGGVHQRARHSSRERTVVHRGGGGWWWTFGFVVLAALIAAAFPREVRRVGGALRASPGVTLFAGFAALICVPFAALILMITIIGLPIALVVMLLYGLLLLVGYAAAGVMLGDAALQRFRAQDAGRIWHRIGAAVAAMLALALVAKVPLLGGFVVLAAMLFGMGAIVMSIVRPAPPAAAA
jgi:hypothetical protein